MGLSFPFSASLLIVFIIAVGLSVSGCTPQPEDRGDFTIRGEMPFDGKIFIDR